MPYSDYRPDLMGSATLEPSGRVEAGSMQSFTLIYTAGRFGLDDTGSLKIGFRFATDFGPVQFTDPKGAGYTTVEASNGATLDVKWEFKRNIRPWSRSLYIGVVKEFLAPGDTIRQHPGLIDPKRQAEIEDRILDIDRLGSLAEISALLLPPVAPAFD